MNAQEIKRRRHFSLLGAVLVALCGLVLWRTPLGEGYVNASYDYLFRFGARSPTNNVVALLMDNEAYDHFHQVRGQPWDRDLHAQLLRRLAADGCTLVVFDTFFRQPLDPKKDQALAEAMRQQGQVVLMAEQAAITDPGVAGVHPMLPTEPFLSAAGHWGVAWLDPDLDSVVRRHWPFPAPGPSTNLAWAAAQLAGARLSQGPHDQWLRYYGTEGCWPALSYRFALTQPSNYFRSKIVFVGTQPQSTTPGDEPDEFRTPYTRWTGESMGGVQIMITSFLNLTNGDWLRRPAAWSEALVLLAMGCALGSGLCLVRPLVQAVWGPPLLPPSLWEPSWPVTLPIIGFPG